MIENVRFHNVTCRGENGVLISGEPGKLRDISFDGLRVELRESSKWEKHCYDLRPGVNQGIVHRKASPLWIHGVEGLTLANIVTRDFGSQESSPEDVAIEDCRNVVRR